MKSQGKKCQYDETAKERCTELTEKEMRERRQEEERVRPAVSWKVLGAKCRVARRRREMCHAREDETRRMQHTPGWRFKWQAKPTNSRVRESDATTDTGAPHVGGETHYLEKRERERGTDLQSVGPSYSANEGLLQPESCLYTVCQLVVQRLLQVRTPGQVTKSAMKGERG